MTLPSDIHTKAGTGFSTQAKLCKWFPDVGSWLPTPQPAISQTKDLFNRKIAPFYTFPAAGDGKEAADTEFSLVQITDQNGMGGHERPSLTVCMPRNSNPRCCWAGVLHAMVIYFKSVLGLLFNIKDKSVAIQLWPLFLQYFCSLISNQGFTSSCGKHLKLLQGTLEIWWHQIYTGLLCHSFLSYCNWRGFKQSYIPITMIPKISLCQ